MAYLASSFEDDYLKGGDITTPLSLGRAFSESALGVDKQDKKDKRNMYLMAYLLDATADANDQFNAGALTSIIDTLDRMGVETGAIKKCVEAVTGRSYQEFASEPDTKYNAGAFRSHMQLGSDSSFDSARAIRISRSDDASLYECARGVGNVLLGLGYNVQRDHATNWDTNLMKQGWVRLPASYMGRLPEGAVLVYNNNEQAGKGAVHNGKGAEYGHVEIAVRKQNGEIGYLSDTLRDRPGGSVPGNFSGAFVSPQQAAELGIGRNGPQMAQETRNPAVFGATG